MRHYLKFAILFFGSIALLPFPIALIGVFYDGLGFALVLLVGLPALVALVVGTVIFFIHGIRCAGNLSNRYHQAAVVLASPLFAIGAFVLAPASLGLGRHTGDLMQLAFKRPRYDAIVATVRAEQSGEVRGKHGGVTYWVDAGRPLRIVFDRQGMFSGSSGVVFDPTGEVMLARSTEPDGILDVFDRELASCRHLWGSYYKCSFA